LLGRLGEETGCTPLEAALLDHTIGFGYLIAGWILPCLHHVMLCEHAAVIGDELRLESFDCNLERHLPAGSLSTVAETLDCTIGSAARHLDGVLVCEFHDRGHGLCVRHHHASPFSIFMRGSRRTRVRLPMRIALIVPSSIAFDTVRGSRSSSRPVSAMLSTGFCVVVIVIS